MRCLSHCLEHGGTHVSKPHLNLMFECQSICQLTASVLHLRSIEAIDFCRLCAKICDACADACKETRDDSVMDGCAFYCRGCADSCRAFISSSQAA